MPNLNNSVMQRLPVFYPDQETQATIIETFATIDEKLSAAVQKQTALQDLFRTLLHELMTAKTRVMHSPFPAPSWQLIATHSDALLNLHIRNFRKIEAFP